MEQIEKKDIHTYTNQPTHMHNVCAKIKDRLAKLKYERRKEKKTRQVERTDNIILIQNGILMRIETRLYRHISSCCLSLIGCTIESDI